LEESLTVLNYRVIATANGREALETVKQHRDGITLILSDLVMPEMGGQALFHALREHSVTVPMIILTGHPMKTELEALQTQGLTGWMLKPPDMEALSRLLAQTIHQET
jgi:two-component system cell cycle sensor histidine kinase/response regulator CckA